MGEGDGQGLGPGLAGNGESRGRRSEHRRLAGRVRGEEGEPEQCGISEAKSKGGHNGHADAAPQLTTWGPWGAGARRVLGRVNGTHFTEGRGEWEEREGRKEVVDSSCKCGEEEKGQRRWLAGGRVTGNRRGGAGMSQRPLPTSPGGEGLWDSSTGPNQLIDVG